MPSGAALAGSPLPAGGRQLRELEATFPFDETPDQAAAIDAVLGDMESPRAMDRLVCGDVGYGKTEVALRAIFRAVQGGKQACVLGRPRCSSSSTSAPWPSGSRRFR